MKKQVSNFEQSIHQKLLNQAKANHQPFEHVLKRYAMERFLYRLSISLHVSEFILKGGLLLACYDMPSSRPTLDIDLQSFSLNHHQKRIEDAIREVCQIQAEPDGLLFDETSLVCHALNHLDGYEGIGVHLLCFLGRAEITVKIDIGFSGSFQLVPILIDYPAMLSFPKPRLQAYRQESVIAEKFEAMVKHDLATSRMKDFYDIWMLSTTFEYDSLELSIAIEQTFRQCKRKIEADPFVLQSMFGSDVELGRKWKVFIQKNDLVEAPRDFATVSEHIREFLLPIVTGLAKNAQLTGRWIPPGPWRV